jgi:hypothetical protein
MFPIKKCSAYTRTSLSITRPPCFGLSWILAERESDALGEVFLFEFKPNRIVLRVRQIGRPIDDPEDKEYGRVGAERDAKVAFRPC